MIAKCIQVLFLLTLTSCAFFKSHLISGERKYLKEEDLASLNSSYEVVGFKGGISKRDIHETRENSAYRLGFSMDTMAFSLKGKRLDIKLLSVDTIQFTFADSKGVFARFVIPGKLKHGCYYLKNTILECHGLPYILGGCNNEKTRIGLTKNNDLFIQNAVDNTGAFLLIFASGYSYNYVSFYKRKQ